MGEVNDHSHVHINMDKWIAAGHAFRNMPARDGRFTGTHEQQKDLAEQLRQLPDDDPGANSIPVEREELSSFANDLETAEPHWSIGQWFSAFESLVIRHKHGLYG